MNRSIGVAALVVLCGGSVHAHDIAVFPQLSGTSLQLTVRYGHPGDYGNAAPGKLVALDAHAPSGQPQTLAGRVRAEGANLATLPLEIDASQAGAWIVAAFYDNGFSLRTPEGRTVNTTRAEYPAAEQVTHNLKYGKALVRIGGSGKGYDRPVGQRLEIVPRDDPFAVGAGGTLAVEVRFDNAPLPNATVRAYPNETTTETIEGATDASGVARIAMPAGKLRILSVEHSVPSRHPELATRDAYAASLVISLP
jgi:uncharacterized GH25 family protein